MNLDLPVDLSGLVALQERLRAFLADYEEKVAQARTQLHHVEALLSHFPASGSEKPSPSPRVAEASLGTRRKRNNVLEFASAYQGKTLTEAVLAVMEAHRGQCVDADGIVKAIYGDVTDEKLAMAKDRITKNLSKGKIDGLWERVPSHLGYYTVSVADLPSDAGDLSLPKKFRGGRTKNADISPAPKTNGRRKKEVVEVVKVRRMRNSLGGLKMRSPYQGFTMMDAIAKVLQERKGEFVNATIVVKDLYGELPMETLKVVKDRITKGLSKGKIDGLWERVPERSGYYTLTMSAVMA